MGGVERQIRISRLVGLTAAAMVLVGFTALWSAGTASAQSAPAMLYGKGGPLKAGDRIEASVGGKAFAAATVTAAIAWAIQFSINAPCAPTDSAAISIAVNGQPSSLVPAAVWKIGGLPPDQANGYVVALGDSPASTPATPSTGGLKITGSVPKAGGYGLLVVTTEGTLAQLVAATGCPPETMALYATAEGGGVTYVHGTSIAVVNGSFLVLFPTGVVPAGTGFGGRCV